MAVPSGYSAELLREGGEFTLYRGIELGNQMPILAVEVTADDPSSQGLRRLEHECSLGGSSMQHGPLSRLHSRGNTDGRPSFSVIRAENLWIR